jgi:hypothetical protein
VFRVFPEALDPCFVCFALSRSSLCNAHHHVNCTCIDKKSNYDLLNPLPCSPPPPPKPWLHEKIKNTKADKKLALAELLLICHDCLKSGKHVPEPVTPFNVAGTIHQHINTLANEESLHKHEQQIKSDFKQIFEQIPHIDEFPMNIVAEIYLKNVEKTIRTLSYPSPRKYKDVWQILIQQHLDAGCISVLYHAPHIPAGMEPFHWNLQEWHRNPQEWTGIHRNGTGIYRNGTGIDRSGTGMD